MKERLIEEKSFFFTASIKWNHIKNLNIDLNSPFIAQGFIAILKIALLKMQGFGSEIEWGPRNDDLSLNIGAFQFSYTSK